MKLKKPQKMRLVLPSVRKPVFFQFGKQTRSLLLAKRFNLDRKKLANLKMPKVCLQVLLGTLLGDGSLSGGQSPPQSRGGSAPPSKIQKHYANARFEMRHALRYMDWFNWKAKNLRIFASEKAVHQQKPSGRSYGKTDMLHFQTKVNTELTIVHSVVTKKNKLNIKRSWLNHLTPISLMCWWLDDGALTANWRQGLFCCESFNLKQQKILVKYLRTVWQINARIVPRRVVQKEKGIVVKEITPPQPHTYLAHRIKLSTNELKKFLRIIMPHIPCENMVYKACIRYNNSKLQKRWISELKKALPQFSVAIDKFYS